MNGAIVISWKNTIPGREAKGLEVFGRAVERFEGMAKTGRIHAHQEYFSITGANGGFMLVSGALDELLKISAEPETLALNSQASAIVDGFAIQVFAGGTDKAVQEMMGTYTESMGALGYM